MRFGKRKHSHQKFEKKWIFFSALFPLGKLCSKTLQGRRDILELDDLTFLCIFPYFFFLFIHNLAKNSALLHICHFCLSWITLVCSKISSNSCTHITEDHYNRQVHSAFFRLPNLTGHKFVAPWAMIVNSISFYSPRPYLFVLNLKKQHSSIFEERNLGSN